jgi:hypothetical protein
MVTVVFYTSASTSALCHSVTVQRPLATAGTMLQSKQSIHKDGSEEGVERLLHRVGKGGKWSCVLAIKTKISNKRTSSSSSQTDLEIIS